MVSLFVAACARDDVETMMTAGYGFAALHEMTGGDRDVLRIMVRDAAARAVLAIGDLPPAS